MEAKPIRFIDEEIEVYFDQPPIMQKKPGCPDGFTWRGRTYRIAEMLGEWADFTRRGKFARNMTPGHAATASRRGSWGVGRFFFRVHVVMSISPTVGHPESRVFDLYYDRAPKDAGDRMGTWFLYRELAEE